MDRVKNNSKKIALNLLFGIGGQSITICFGIILPRLLLVSFGSEINGLISTVSQVYTYVAILEAGIGSASLNILYKRFADNDKDGITNAISATRIYFRKVSIIYGVCVFLATAIFPYVFDTYLDKATIALVVFLQGVSGLVNFTSISAYQQLLLADGRSYVCSIIDLSVTIISYIARIVLICTGFNVVVVQVAYCLVTVLKAGIVKRYFVAHYSWIVLDNKADISILNQRKAFMVHEISGVINSSTDVIILSVFCGLKYASVYTVYNLIYNNLHALITKLSSSLDFYLGQTYHASKEKYIKLHDIVECYYVTVTFAVFTTAYYMTSAFIKLYTKGVNDANYLDSILPFLFVSIELMSCTRLISSKLINIAGHTRRTQLNTILEASINIVSSIILVNFMDIKGVLLGTIISSLYRTNDIIVYANRRILNRSPINTYKMLSVNILIFTAFALIKRSLLHFTIKSYGELVIYGSISLIIILVTYMGLISLVSHKNAKELVRILFKHETELVIRR